MTGFASSRRRLLLAKGRPAVLARPSGPSVTLLAFVREDGRQELGTSAMAGQMLAGDERCEIGVSEITAAGWPGPPRKPDRLTIDGRTLVIQAARPVCDGSEVVGYTCFVRGAG